MDTTERQPRNVGASSGQAPASTVRLDGHEDAGRTASWPARPDSDAPRRARDILQCDVPHDAKG